MKKQKCDDCITRGISWGQIMAVALPLLSVVSFTAVDMYKNSESRALTVQIANSINKTNKELLKKGIISDPLFVQMRDTNKTFQIADNTIYKKPPKRRIANNETAFDNENLESKITE